LENARLSEEITLQKTLAETLLTAIPPGIIACDEHGLVRWCNPTAESILGIAAADVLNRPIETAGSRIASVLRETIESQVQFPSQQWIDAHSRRSLSVQTRRLIYQEEALGAVAVIQDMTPEESLRQKQELLDRAAFGPTWQQACRTKCAIRWLRLRPSRSSFPSASTIPIFDATSTKSWSRKSTASIS
jgi:PAS domain-containing protein